MSERNRHLTGRTWKCHLFAWHGKKKGVWAESCASLVTTVPRAAGTAASRCAGELVGAHEMCAGPEPPSCSCGFLPPAKPYC